jgi:hypothetical protein
MKKLFYSVVCTIIIALSVTSCTDNERSRMWGGTSTIVLPAGQKLINASWKDDDMWILTRPMHSNETAESYSYREESNFGVLEGTIVITEIK